MMINMVTKIPLEQITTKEQVRKEMSNAKIDELVSSIRTQGLIQPIVVQKVGENNYEVLIGHRRFLAMKRLNEKSISAVISDGSLSKEDTCKLQLVENAQREDLTVTDKASAINSLLENNITQKEIAFALGKSEATISKYINLYKVLDKDQTLKEIVNKIGADRAYNKYCKEKKNKDENQMITFVSKISKTPETKDIVVEQINKTKQHLLELEDLLKQFKD